MATTEVQLSERQPMLISTTEEVVHSNPVASSTIPIESSTTIIRKDVEIVPEDKNKFIQVIRPLLVELIGTMLFVLIGMWGACSGGVLNAALAFGLALMVFAASFGHISGVHFNPAVTLGILIAGEMQAVMAVLYVVMQLLGGIAAGGLLRLLLATRIYNDCKGGATLLTKYIVANETSVKGGVYVADYVRIWQGILIEFIVTFILVTVILMVVIDTKSKTGLASILVGFTLAANILAVGTLTGGSLNPARSLGPAIFAEQWEHHYVYWIGPLVGAVVAGFLYRTVWAHYDRRMFVKRTTTTVKA
ncbi:unnamed protein product [Rotaria sordida]|uniref:Aquaporin n=1 Tax=Rotaria sordida TaxID=392033 RepID=A0A818X215_9BILA|nr:unnamed protein product [Rotaria sordida]CAF1070358.1 unnamed protein product [Rotaria sordida]CAF1144389.1 unnamed protein product [Rotaria sordida]CAF1314157.1 unnamed protein product [Rotaria sordida]CAF1316860.1 unnamed protein product [Rotaria sordida]